MGAGPSAESPAGGDPLLVSLCRRTPYPVALADVRGAVIASSPLFDALLLEDPGLSRAVESSVGLASSHRRVPVQLSRLTLELAPLDGTLLVRVRAYGPEVVRSRLHELGGTQLSARESECLSLALEARHNAAIASELGVRPETVKVHLRNAYRKLGATGRTPLLARMVEG